MNTTNGKIAIESKKKLTAALFKVMELYNFKEITVTQIAQEAELSRKTFYRLFKDKEEILSYFYETFFLDFFSQFKSKKINHYWDIVQFYFDFWEQKKSLLLLFKKNNLLSDLFENAYKYSINIFDFIRPKETIEKLSPHLPYLLSYSMGGINGMLIKWVENEMTMPSKVLIQILKESYKSELI